MAEVGLVTGTSLWAMVKQTAEGWDRINAPRLGAALSFYTLLSMAPLLVVSIGIAGMIVGHDAARAQIETQIQTLVGPQGGRVLQGLLDQVTQPARSFAATSVGFLTLLFGASGVFGELRDSLNLVWSVQTNSHNALLGLIKRRFVSFAMVLAVGFLLLVSLVLSAVISAIGKFFQQYLPVPESVLQFGNLVLSFLAVTLLFALLYKVVPDARIEWRDVLIGAAATSALFSIGKFLIGLYLGKASVGSAYGAAGSVVVFMVWVYYSAQIFFFGAEFTRVYADRHGSRARRWADRHARRHNFRHQPKLA